MDKPSSNQDTALSQHYIPVRLADLQRLLQSELADLADAETAESDFVEFCKLVTATFHHEFHVWLEELKDAYAHFNPDADTVPIELPGRSEQERLSDTFFKRCNELLERGNFRRLSEEEIEGTLSAASDDWGLRLHVDFEAFDRLDVYSRGDAIERRKVRTWSTYYQLTEVEIPVYPRLVVLFRLREDHLPENAPKLERDVSPIYLKIFKNVPKVDVNMLLPAATVRMTTFDLGKILVPTVSGIAVAIFKIVKSGVLLALSSFWGILGILGFVGTTIGYGVNSYFGYVRAREKYQFNLTRSLYYQNLDNNAGVIFRLLDDAEEQECRETILAYFLLWRYAGEQGWTADELDQRAEKFLLEHIERAVDFEVRDGVDKLLRLDLAEQVEDDRIRAVPIDDAIRRMDAVWDACFSR